MRPLGVIPFNPLSNGGAGFGEADEVMLPDTLFLETAKEAFDEAVLLRRIRRDEFLVQTVIAAGGTKMPALKNQSIIRAHDRVGPGGRNVPKRARQASSSTRSASLARPRKASHCAVVAINNRGQVTPAVGATRHVGEVHGPALIALLRTAPAALDGGRGVATR
jgi:hypothetical protein